MINKQDQKNATSYGAKNGFTANSAGTKMTSGNSWFSPSPNGGAIKTSAGTYTDLSDFKKSQGLFGKKK